MRILAPKGFTFPALVILLLIITSLGLNSVAIFASTSAWNDTRSPLAPEAAGTWTPAGTFADGRHEHTATLLSDGRVLIVGGLQQRTPGSPGLASAEVYDPASGTWSTTGSLEHGRTLHTATLMANGKVLVVGGACDSGTPGIVDAADVYDPATLTWSATTALPTAREAHTATLLPDGTVLVVGGDNGDTPRYDSALIYDPAGGAWSPTGSLMISRRNHTATLLDDGTVLVSGGWGDTSTSLEGAERYQGTVIDTPSPADTPLPATNTPTHTPTVAPTNTPLPTIMAPTGTPTNTPPPPTDAFFLGGNPTIVLLSAVGTAICAGATIGLVAMIAGIVLYFRSARRR